MLSGDDSRNVLQLVLIWNTYACLKLQAWKKYVCDTNQYT
jgi:hypothetical protein